MPGPAVTRIFCHLTRASVRVPVAGRGCPAGQGAALACRVAISETEPVTERLQVREIDDDDGRRLVRIIRRSSGSVVTGASNNGTASALAGLRRSF